MLLKKLSKAAKKKRIKVW